MDWVTAISLIGGVIGAVGGMVGIYTAVVTHQRATDERMEKDNEFSFLAAFMEAQLKVGDRVGPIMTQFEIGSTDWKRAEELVRKGVLTRGPNGRGYRLVGFYEKALKQ